MGDAICDEVREILSGKNLEPHCPFCGSKELLASYGKVEYLVDLEKEESEELIDTQSAPKIYCYHCGEEIC